MKITNVNGTTYETSIACESCVGMVQADEAKRPSALVVAKNTELLVKVVSYVVPFTFVIFIRFSGNVSLFFVFAKREKQKKRHVFQNFE